MSGIRGPGLIGFVALAAGLWGGCGGTTTLGNGGTDAGTDGGVPGYAACDGPGQCKALVPGCCGVCGAPALSDVTGVNASRVTEFKAATCHEKNPICPKCAQMTEPNLVAFCESDRCTARDVRTEELSACQTDSDCVLRTAECCSPCQVEPFQLIAIAKAHAEDFRASVCAPTDACPHCVVQMPPGHVASCGPQHHCQVTEQTTACPADVPASDLACSAEGVTCEYGDEIRPGCRTKATCTQAKWQVAVAGCPPLPGPGEKGCPTAITTGDCSPDGLQCDMGGDSTCVCASCLGPCSITPVWACARPPTTPGCPSRAPRLGTACTQESLVCTYGPLCAPMLSAGRRCANGVWSDEPLACPA